MHTRPRLPEGGWTHSEASWVQEAGVESFEQRVPGSGFPGCGLEGETCFPGVHVLLAPVGKDRDGKGPGKHLLKCGAQSRPSGRADA